MSDNSPDLIYDTEDTNRQFKNSKASFIYDEKHIDKNKYISWLTSKVNVPIDFIRLAHIEDEGDKYTKVVVAFQRPFRTNKKGFFTYENIIPHITPIANNQILYSEKMSLLEDDDNKDLKKLKNQEIQPVHINTLR